MIELIDDKKNDMSLVSYFNTKCREVLQKWSISEIDAPHVMVVQPENGGVFNNNFVMELALAHYNKLNIRRSFENCFLSLKYKGKDARKEDYDRFFDSARVQAGNYNRFIGTFAVDISEFIKIPDYPAFEYLLDYVDSTSKDIKYIFSVSTDDKTAISRLYGIIRNRFRIELINMGYSDVDYYVNCVITMLQNRGIAVNENIEQVLADYIEKIHTQKSFAGVDSITRLVDDIVCEVYRYKEMSEIPEVHLSEIMDRVLVDEYDDYSMRKIGF
jgi:hypothetical protein